MLGGSLSEDGSGFYLYIRQSSEGRGPLGGVSTLQETGLTGPISIYKLVPKVGYSLCPIQIHPMQLKDAKLGYSWAVFRHCFRQNNCQRQVHLSAHRQVVMRYCPFS